MDSEFRDLSFTNPGTLPNSGSASYNGVLGYGAGDAAVVGEMRLDANFGSNTISGNVGNFVDSENGRYGGSLSVSDGQIDRSADTSVEYTFLADIGGTLSQNGDNYVVNGNMRGDFLGDDYRGVEGDTVVSVIGPGVNGIVEGGFIGKR